jgi:hypothetical protein
LKCEIGKTMAKNPEPFDPADNGAQGGPGTRGSSSGVRVVRLKKSHPCGGEEFTVVRESVTVTLKCTTCDSIVRLEKGKFLKAVKN